MWRAWRAEWAKFWSCPVCVVATAAAIILPSLLAFLLLRVTAEHGPISTSDLVASCLRGSQLSQVAIIVACAAIAGQEDARSAWRTTVLTVPRRAQLLGAKLLVAMVVSVVACVVSGSLAGLVNAVLFHIDPTVAADLVTSIAPTSISWALLGVFSLAVGVITRSMLIPVAILTSLILGGSSLLLGLTTWAKYLPDLATTALFTPDSALLSPVSGVVVQGVYALVAAGVAARLSQIRDIR